jgi:hypothetical protein
VMCSFSDLQIAFASGAVACFLGAMVGGCPSQTQPLTPVDASDAASTPCAAACAVLKSLGCPEGAQTDCVQVLAHIDGARAIRTPSGEALTCAAIAAAQSVSAVEALGVGCRD